MNHSMDVFLISTQVRAVDVTYEADPPGGGKAKTYTYKTFNQLIQVDDYVVVPTDTRHNMTVCKVVKVDVDPDFDSDYEMKWIIGVVFTADFDSIKEQEAEAISKIKSAEKHRKREELRKALLADTGESLKKLPIYDDSTRENSE